MAKKKLRKKTSPAKPRKKKVAKKKRPAKLSKRKAKEKVEVFKEPLSAYAPPKKPAEEKKPKRQYTRRKPTNLGEEHYIGLKAPVISTDEADRELKSFVKDTSKRAAFKPFNRKVVSRMIYIGVVEQAADLIDPAGDTERLAKRVRRSYRATYGSAMLSGLLISIIVGIIANLIAKWLKNWWDNRQTQFCLSDDLIITEQIKMQNAMGKAASRWIVKDSKNGQDS